MVKMSTLKGVRGQYRLRVRYRLAGLAYAMAGGRGGGGCGGGAAGGGWASGPPPAGAPAGAAGASSAATGGPRPPEPGAGVGRGGSIFGMPGYQGGRAGGGPACGCSGRIELR